MSAFFYYLSIAFTAVLVKYQQESRRRNNFILTRTLENISGLKFIGESSNDHLLRYVDNFINTPSAPTTYLSGASLQDNAEPLKNELIAVKNKNSPFQSLASLVKSTINTLRNVIFCKFGDTKWESQFQEWHHDNYLFLFRLTIAIFFVLYIINPFTDVIS